jgi:hypothetical protein
MSNLDRRPSIDDSCQAELKRTKEQKMRKQKFEQYELPYNLGDKLGCSESEQLSLSTRL